MVGVSFADFDEIDETFEVGVALFRGLHDEPLTHERRQCDGPQLAPESSGRAAAVLLILDVGGNSSLSSLRRALTPRGTLSPIARGRRSSFAVLHTPVTTAPNALAICTANVPTPPDAVMISTRCPASTRPTSQSP